MNHKMEEFICNCGRKFLTRGSLNSHARFCSLYKKKEKPVSKYKSSNGEYICECGKDFINFQSFNAHLSHCDKHHESIGTIRKKRPSEINNSMNWENKSEYEINEIHKRSGKTHSLKMRNGEIVPSFTRRKHTIETKEKTRLSTIKYIKSLKGNFKCRYNKNSIDFINNLNKENDWNLQHAENGGEVNIGGYFVDGYDKDLNIVFEYDEPGHYIDKENSILCDKDIERQKFIINKIGCKFYRYNEAIDYLYEVKI